MTEDGRRTVSDSTILDAIEQHEPEATTSTIAAEIDLSNRGTRYRLNQLEEQGVIESTTIGQSKVWTVINN